jgi:hypothetical protein
VAHARPLLRHVFENRDEARHWGGRLRQQIMANFTTEQVTPQLLAALSRLLRPERDAQPWRRPLRVRQQLEPALAERPASGRLSLCEVRGSPSVKCA